MTPALLALLLLAAPRPAHAEPTLKLTAREDVYPVSRAQVLVDQERKVSIGDILGRAEGEGASWDETARFNFGYTHARLWLKVRVQNASSEREDWLLEYGYPLAQVVEMHQAVGGREVARAETGRLKPFASRPMGHRNFIFPFRLPKGSETELYVMVESAGTVFAPLTVHSRESLLARTDRDTLAMGVYSGAIVAMILYNLFLFASIRDGNYLLYAAYSASFCLLMASLNGIAYQYLWPGQLRWNKVSVPVLAGLSYLFLTLFTRPMLETRRLAPRLDRLLDLVAATAVLLILNGLFNYGHFTNRMTSIFISSVPLVMIPISAVCALRGAQAAVYYLVAFGCFFTGSAAHAARDLAWLPQNSLTEYGVYLGSMAEFILLSLALAARIKRLKEESLHSQMQAAEAERRQRAVSDLALQVAHDIRSPLAALAAAEADLSSLADETRSLIRKSIGRIRGIAEDLIENHLSGTQRRAGKPEPLATILEAIVAEKRLQFQHRADAELVFVSPSETDPAYSRVDADDLKRDLSNIINNAFESSSGAVRVTATLTSVRDCAVIAIEDDGRGVPPEVLSRLGERGVTSGKPGGLGLGLHQASANAASWGGSLRVESSAGKGTRVEITLPRTAPPPRPVERTTDGRPDAVLIDDDPLVRATWTAAARSRGKVLAQFPSLVEFKAASAEIPKDIPIYLDLELGAGPSGLEIAKELHASGFGDISLSTGHPPESLPACPWIRRVLGKEPPWA